MKVVKIVTFIVATLIISSFHFSCGSSSSYTAPIDVNTLGGETNVAVNNAFKYTFSQSVDTSTVTSSSFFIVPAGGANANIGIKATYDPAICDATLALDATVTCAAVQMLDPSCTLDPSSELEYITNYTICLTTDIEYQDSIASLIIRNAYAGDSFEGFSATFATEGFTVGGTVEGLTGSGLILQNNSADDLSITEDGTFVFDTGLADGSSYEVTVLVQPDGQTCSISNGSGTISGANVTDVALTCSDDAYTIGGTISGLNGTVVLQNNGGDDLSISANGSFAFSTEVADGAEYAVTIKTQPNNQTCTVANGTGTIDGADVDDVTVTCETTSFTVGGTTTWEEGFYTGLVLQNNGGDDLEITSTDPFTFSTVLADGSAYEVTVETHATSNFCWVTDGSGTINGANVTNVEVTCSTK